MWAEAAKLSISPGAIQCTPYCEKNTLVTPVYLVLSGSYSREFHSVEYSDTLSAVVKCSCAWVKSSGVGRHALAVCEKVGWLSQFLQYCSAKKRRLNLKKSQPRG